MSDSVQPYRRQSTRHPRPWDFPGKSTGVGCHFLLWCTKVKSESEVTQLCTTLSDPTDCSLPGSSLHGIFQARVLEWRAIAFSLGDQDFFLSLQIFMGKIDNTSVQSLSRVQLFVTPWTACSTPGLPVHHQYPESTQTHVYWVDDAIQPSHPLSSLSPSPNPSQHQGLFQWINSSCEVAKVLEFQLQ